MNKTAKNNVKTATIKIRCTEKEKEMIKNNSSTNNMTVTDYIMESVKHNTKHKKNTTTSKSPEEAISMSKLLYHTQNIVNILNLHDMEIPEIKKECDELWNMLH